MNVLQFLLILKARAKIIAITLAVIVVTAMAITMLIPKSYTATTSLLMNYKGLDPVTGVMLPAQLMPGYMATQVDIIYSKNIALKVVDQLGLAKSEQAQQQFQDKAEGKGDINSYLADLLLKNLNVKPSRESSVIEISYTAVEPSFAAIIANTFAENYLSTSIQLKTQPAQKATEYFAQQIKLLRGNLEEAQTRLSTYQHEKGITNPEQSYDVESMRLNELSTQLSVAQAAAIDAQSRKSSAQRNAADSPDVALSPVVQNIKVDLSRAETKLAEVAQRLGVNHPEYQSAQSDVTKLRSQLREEIQTASNSITGSANINSQRESELRAQVAAQKIKVLELNRLRDEMSVLIKDVDTAQKAMDAVSMRLSQTSMEGQSNQSDIAILNPATAPIKHSSPKKLLILIISIFMGTIVGVALALVAELIDRRVRSVEDIAYALELPVFAVIAAKPKRRSMSLLPRPVQKLLLPSA